MYTAVVVIQIIVSIVLIISVLLQVGKGATMGSSFGGGSSSQTVFGSAGPATMLAKITWVCLVIFLLSSIYLTHLSSAARKSSIMSDVPAVTSPPAGSAEPQAPAAAAPAAEPASPKSEATTEKAPAMMKAPAEKPATEPAKGK